MPEPNKPAAPFPEQGWPGISIVIPSWNGLHLLRECLHSVLAAARCYTEQTGAPTELIVADDGSTDQTTAAFPLEFPGARLIAKPRNEGFAQACNAGFSAVRYPLIALLNNDVKIEPDYFRLHAMHFADPRVFAVTAKVYAWDRPLFMTGGRFGKFRRGFWSVYFNYDVNDRSDTWVEERKLLSAYAIGGFVTYSTEKVRELGGFNPLLSPFHWEDVDLSYRGWKRGWSVHYEPRSIAHHKVSATIDSHFKKRHVDAVSFRNRLLFHWINLHSPSFLARHVLMLAIFFVTRFAVLDWDFYRSLGQALRQLRQALRLRQVEKARSVRSDAEVSKLLRGFYRHAPIRVYYQQSDVPEEPDETGQGAIHE